MDIYNGWTNALSAECVGVVFMCLFMNLGRSVFSSDILPLTQFYRDIANKEQQKKVVSNAWYSFYYCVIFPIGVYLLFRYTGWGHSPGICGYEESYKAFERYPVFHLYYFAQISFYISYIVSMIRGEDAHRKDQRMLLFHHAVTLALIVFSRVAGHLRIQLAMLVLHDAADPMLHLAKLIKYARPKATLAYDIALAGFAVVFVVTRLIAYPVYLMTDCKRQWDASYPVDWYRVTGNGPLFTWDNDYVRLFGYNTSYYGWAYALLCVLLLLQVVWLAQIARVAWRKIVHEGIGAPASYQKRRQENKIK